MLGRRIIKQGVEDEVGVFFDAAMLAAGTLSGQSGYTSQDILTSIYNGTDGLQLIGRPNQIYSVAWSLRYPNLSKWEMAVDLTNYKYLKFAARKVANYGCIMVSIDGANPEYDTDPGLLWAKYTIVPTDWTQYSVSVADLTGTHTWGLWEATLIGLAP